MPSSDECHAAAQEIQKWYWENVIVPQWGDGAAAKEISSRTTHAEKRNEFLKRTGKYAGPYSPY
jgi:hypothetical protein